MVMERLDQWSERINEAMALLNIFEEAEIMNNELVSVMLAVNDTRI